MNRENQLVIIVLVFIVLILSACTREIPIEDKTNIKQPLGIQIAPQEEMDGIDQAIIELDETDSLD